MKTPLLVDALPMPVKRVSMRSRFNAPLKQPQFQLIAACSPTSPMMVVKALAFSRSEERWWKWSVPPFLTNTSVTQLAIVSSSAPAAAENSSM